MLLGIPCNNGRRILIFRSYKSSVAICSIRNIELDLLSGRKNSTTELIPGNDSSGTLNLICLRPIAFLSLHVSEYSTRNIVFGINVRFPDSLNLIQSSISTLQRIFQTELSNDLLGTSDITLSRSNLRTLISQRIDFLIESVLDHRKAISSVDIIQKSADHVAGNVAETSRSSNGLFPKNISGATPIIVHCILDIQEPFNNTEELLATIQNAGSQQAYSVLDSADLVFANCSRQHSIGFVLLGFNLMRGIKFAVMQNILGDVDRHMSPDASPSHTQTSFRRNEYSGYSGFLNRVKYSNNSITKKLRINEVPHHRVCITVVIDGRQSAISIHEITAGIAVIMLASLFRNTIEENIIEIFDIGKEQRLFIVGTKSIFERFTNASFQMLVTVIRSISRGTDDSVVDSNVFAHTFLLSK